MRTIDEGVASAEEAAEEVHRYLLLVLGRRVGRREEDMADDGGRTRQGTLGCVVGGWGELRGLRAKFKGRAI